MSQVIDLCEGSDDNGEWPNANTASVPSLPLSRKRPRDKEELSNDIHPRKNGNDPVNKTATGSAEFIDDLELANEVQVMPHRKRRGVDVRSERSGKNAVAGSYAQILEGVEVTEQDVGSEDSNQTSRDDDGSIKRHSQKLSFSKPPSNASGQQWRDSTWEDRLSQLAAYRKIHGHCNVPKNDSENTQLDRWVKNPKESIQVARKRKEIKYDHFPNPGIGTSFLSARGGTPKKPSLDEDVTRVRERVAGVPEHVQQTQEYFSARDIGSNQVDFSSEGEESNWIGVYLAYIPGRTVEI
jgi:hypothetical protein